MVSQNRDSFIHSCMKSNRKENIVYRVQYTLLKYMNVYFSLYIFLIIRHFDFVVCGRKNSPEEHIDSLRVLELYVPGKYK